MEFLDKLVKPLNKKSKEEFWNEVMAQADRDKHDLAIEEKMESVEHCFAKTTFSVTLKEPDTEELYAFRMCL
jgi:hypothetical protein